MDEQFQALLAEFAKLRSLASVPADRDLWDSDTIGAYLKCSATHVMQRYAPRTDFPTTIRLPTGGSRGTPRWKATEVMAWAEKFREKRAA